MINSGKLAGRTIFITGASRGIGKAIALKAAKDGANVVIAAKTGDPHPKLPGTIYSAAKEVEAMGGKALPCLVDVRDEKQVVSAVESAVQKFGGIDIVINNASAIMLTPTLQTDMKRYDLMHNVNTRGTFLVSKVCLPYLKKSPNPHILNISPPLNMFPFWFKDHVAYTMAKYGMSMCVLGMSAEFKDDGIAVNALWPKTAIATAAIEMLAGKESGETSRKPDIMADAAYAILCKEAKGLTGQYLIDEDVLKKEGLTQEQIDHYAVNPANKDNLMPDFFLDLPPDQMKNPIVKPKGDGKPMSDIDKIFDRITKSLNPDLVKSTQAVYQFNVTGANQGLWFVDLKNAGGSAGKGKIEGADSTLTMDGKDFFDMFSGKLKPTMAFMSGKLKIAGNLQKAMKLEKLMTSLKAKL